MRWTIKKPSKSLTRMCRLFLALPGFAGLEIGILLSLLLVPTTVTAQTTGWSQPFKLSSDGISWFPDIAADVTGRVHVVWSSDVLNYRAWDGRVWTPGNDIAVAVDSSGIPIWDPYRAAIVADRTGYLHLFYYHLTEGIGYYSRARLEKASVAQGWGARQVIGARGNGYYTAMGVDSENRIHAVYIDMPTDSILSDLFYRRSEDGGLTWTLLINLSNSRLAGATRPQIIIDQADVIHISWDEGWDRRSGEGGAETSRYIYSTNGGKSWSNPAIFGSPPKLPAAQLVVASAVAAGSRIAIWRAATDNDNNVYYQSSLDNGKKWTNPVPIPGIVARPWNSPLFDQYALARADNGILHLVLVARRSPETDRWAVIHLEWDGKGWSQPEVIFEQEGLYPEYPRIAIALGAQIHVVWFTRTTLWTASTTDIWHSLKTEGPLNTPVPVLPSPELSNSASVNPTVTPALMPTPTKAPTPKPQFSSFDPPSSAFGSMLPLVMGAGAALFSIAAAITVRQWLFRRS